MHFRSRRILLSCLACWFFPASFASGEEPREQVRLLSIHGQAYVTTLSAWSREKWEIEQPDPQEIPTEQVAAVDWFLRPTSAVTRKPQVLLTNGDRISLSLESWNEEALTGKGVLAEKEAVRIPLEFVRGVILQPLSDLRELAREMERIEGHAPGNDLAVLSNGDQILGQILRLEKGTFQFERESANVALEAGQIRSLSLNPELGVTPPDPEGEFAIITLTDGGQLTLSGWERNGERITGSWLGSIAVELPESAVAGIRPRGARVQSLSELTAESYRFIPFLASASVAAKRNRNALGGPFVLEGRVIPRGWGLRSRSEMTFSLGGTSTGFLARLGIDDCAGERGSAVCRVLADGKVLYASPAIRGGEPPVQTPLIDLTGARQLTIEIDYGDEADVLDYVDLTDALLIR